MSTIGRNYGLLYQVTTPTITQGTTTGTSATSSTPEVSTPSSQHTPQYEPVTANGADAQATYALAGMGLNSTPKTANAATANEQEVRFPTKSGNNFERVYDDKGRVLQETTVDALGNKLANSYAYNEDDEVISMTTKMISPEGITLKQGTKINIYDENGNRTTVISDYYYDTNSDGIFDKHEHFEENRTTWNNVSTTLYDNNQDGIWSSSPEDTSGTSVTPSPSVEPEPSTEPKPCTPPTELDTDGDGKIDTFREYYDNGRLKSEFVDKDEDGIHELRTYYSEAGKVTRKDFNENDDDFMETVEDYDANGNFLRKRIHSEKTRKQTDEYDKNGNHYVYINGSKYKVDGNNQFTVGNTRYQATKNSNGEWTSTRISNNTGGGNSPGLRPDFIHGGPGFMF